MEGCTAAAFEDELELVSRPKEIPEGNLTKLPTGLRPFGKLTDDLEELLGEAAKEHDLQLGEILAWVKTYIEIHYPDAVEEYEDGSRPEYYYGYPR